ncbi:uncharacterized protein B0H64DRAFT_130284 [Chaetomium fimeti]|uniref:HECT-type E3 ubiquitin transferase n=1 Tax=Chaetomium fimeti TaxID=1854472 RepID=A0AAE0HJK0_9PEZI|nr:hypothetical protein B0H64DRAFT_130284 [Chaetomium fimeti]
MKDHAISTFQTTEQRDNGSIIVMPPWPGGGGSHRPAEPTPTPTPGRDQHLTPHYGRDRPTVGRYRSASRVSEIDAWDNMQNHQLQNDSSSDEDLNPRPRHTRSVSHPFPSLFSSKKKRSTPVPHPDDSGSDSMGEGPSLKGNPPPVRGHRNGSSSVGSRDFATGRCMTCGSLVRWPRELQMFRCTICLTINDVSPVDRDARREDAQEMAVMFEEQPAPRNKTISRRYTKVLIDQCLRDFLTSTLKKQTGSTTSNKESPVTASFLSPNDTRVPAPSTAAPPSLRPKTSLNFEPRLTLGPPKSPALHRRAPSWAGSASRMYSTSPEKRSPLHNQMPQRPGGRPRHPPPSPGEDVKRVFKPLEDYILQCFTTFQCLNTSFLVPRPQPHGSHGTETRSRRPSEHTGVRRESRSTSYPVPDLDPKLLLLGNFAENGTWWTGHEDALPSRTPSGRIQNGHSIVSSRNPYIDWAALEEWYKNAIEPARGWSAVYESLVAEDPALAVSPAALQDIEAQVLAGQENVQRALLKASETILRRPGRPLTVPRDLRFLLIITANPLLHASYKPYAGIYQSTNTVPTPSGASFRGSGPASGRHSVIIKRIVGLMSNTPVECHNHLVAWFARYSEQSFVQTKDLVSGFLAYRLIRQNEKKYESQVDYMGGLIPNMGPSHSPAALHAALGHSQRAKKQQEKNKQVVYQEDWQIKAAAQVLGFLFAANNMGHAHRGLANRPDSPGNRQRELVQAPGQILATSDFYMTLLDDADLVGEFEAWERRQGKFSFCQHPFLLSIGAKIQILEHDARRQMSNKARDAFFDSILTNRVVQQFLVLNIRRECLVDDSLKAVSEVIGSGGEDVKKKLKIIFKGEEGVDAGGLRKEWFLLLVRELFNPDHGMFLYDEDSHYCYFNPNSLEPSEQFFLVGVVLGLAIYNTTILDVALPPFAFRKLLAAAPLPPSPSPTTTTHQHQHQQHQPQPQSHPQQQQPPHQPRQPLPPTLDDLAEYRPSLARGLRQLLDYPGDDVETVFGLVFAIDGTRYGAVDTTPLCPGGERRAVTSANRREYVDAYVRHVLEGAVKRQFEPFKRGFWTVCGGGNSAGGGGVGGSGTGSGGGGGALSLFRAEEIELLVRGSAGVSDDAPLDVDALRAVAQYDGWRQQRGSGGRTTTNGNGGEEDAEERAQEEQQQAAEQEDTVRWFWEAFAGAEPRDQRRLLAFVTGSDRLPALGAASLAIRVACLGDECGRFPTARTCFNSVGLWRATDRDRFVDVLWRAVWESEGFGLK